MGLCLCTSLIFSTSQILVSFSYSFPSQTRCVLAISNWLNRDGVGFIQFIENTYFHVLMHNKDFFESNFIDPIYWGYPWLFQKSQTEKSMN